MRSWTLRVNRKIENQNNKTEGGNMTNKSRKPGRLTRRTLLTASGAAVASSFLPKGVFTPAIAQTKPLQVGVLAPLSGVYASLGTNKLNGIKMFFNEKQMSVEGSKIELIVEDDEAKPQEGLRKARKLVEQDNADILLGVISSAIGYGLKDYVNRAKKVWITTGAAADGIFKKSNNNPYAFRSSLSVYQANEPMGTWLGDKGLKKVFVTGPDYAMGREAIGAFEKTFKVKGGERVGEVFAPLGTSDFAPFLTEIKRANPEVVYASYAGSDAVRFVQQFNAFGLQNTIKLAGYGYLVEEDTIEAQGPAAIGVYSGLNWAYGIDTPANKAFVANYRKLYNSIPTVDSVAGYVGAEVVWNAFKKLGGKVPDQEALSNAVLETRIDTPRGPISFDPETRNVIQNIYIRETVKDGNEAHNKVLATFEAVRDPGV
jgi:branched-chain amino acid transport system substrate-binding protein